MRQRLATISWLLLMVGGLGAVLLAVKFHLLGHEIRARIAHSTEAMYDPGQADYSIKAPFSGYVSLQPGETGCSIIWWFISTEGHIWFDTKSIRPLTDPILADAGCLGLKVTRTAYGWTGELVRKNPTSEDHPDAYFMDIKGYAMVTRLKR